MDEFAGLQRARLLAAEHGQRVGVVLAVAGVVMLAVAGVAMAAPTEQVVEERNPQTVTTTHAVNATVEETVDPYRAGQTLTNEPRYLFAATSNVTVASTTDLPEGGTADVRMVVTYAVTDDETSLWSTNRTIASTSGTDRVRLAQTLNASALRERAETLGRNFGAGTSVAVTVATRVDYETGPHAGAYRTESAVRFPNSQSYAVAPAERSVTRSETTTVTRVDRDRTVGTTGVSPARVGVGAVGLVLLGGAGWFLRGGRTFDPSVERRRLYAQRYSIYITAVEGPLDYGWPDEFVSSLDALADYAIDTNNQILECRQTGVFLVRDDGRTLVYDPRVEGWNVAAMTPPATPGLSRGVDDDASLPDTPGGPDADGAPAPESFGFDPDVGPESTDETSDGSNDE